MLEWYRVGWDHRRLMEETADLVQAAMALSGRRTSVREISYRDLYRSTLGIDPFTDSDHALRAPLAVYAIDPEGLGRDDRSEEHTSELQSLMRISYAVFCLQTKT